MKRNATALDRLGAIAAAAQDKWLDETERADLDRVRGRLERAPEPPRRSWATWRRIAFVVPLAAGIVAAVFLWAAGEENLHFEVGREQAVTGSTAVWIDAATADNVPVRFSDGTVLTLEPGSKARVVSARKTAARIELARGRTLVAVVPRTKNRWQIHAGPYLIEVTGTRFEAGWEPKGRELEVTLHEGSVRVSGPGIVAPRTVLAGETLEAHDGGRLVRIRSTSALARERRESAASGDLLESRSPGAEPSASPPRRRVAPRTADSAKSGIESVWRGLAAEGRYVEAFRSAHRTGFARACDTADAQELLALGEGARLARDAQRAAEAYGALRARFPRAGEAALGAYAMGRVAFDLRADLREAARWFSAYLREQPNGALAREALGRRMEAEHRAGDRRAAEESARLYSERHPGGPHAGLATELLRASSETKPTSTAP